MRVREESERASLKLNIKKLRSWHPAPLLHGKQKGKMWTWWQISSSWTLKSLWMVTAAMKSEDWQESYDKSRQCVEKQRHYSANKGPYSQGYGLPSGHIWLQELDIKKAECQKMRCLDGITSAMDMNLGKLWEMVRDRQSWHAVVHRVTESDMTGRLNSNKKNNSK